MKKLTIGSAVYDDFEGVYFSYQSIRLNNQNILEDLDLLIIDNNPDSEEGKATKHFCKQANIRYIPYIHKTSTGVRNEIFKNAEGEFSLSMDPHVLFEHDTIKRLISFFEENKESPDLYHGPMLYDQIIGHDPVIQMDPVWRDHMFGTWKSKALTGDKPFEIPMHGLGIFACKTDAWLGFGDKFSGFGGEEGYIHEKFRRAGRKIWCLPFLKWVHRFQRPRGVPYKLDLKDRIRNYFQGFIELNKDPQEIIDHFTQEAPDIDCAALLEEVKSGKVMDPPSISQTITWDVSSIKFNSPVEFQYFRMEFFNDCFLNKIKMLPSKGVAPALHSTSLPHGENMLDMSDDKFCSVFYENEIKEATLDYGKQISPTCINIYHSNGMIMCYTSKDGESWTMISEINI